MATLTNEEMFGTAADTGAPANTVSNEEMFAGAGESPGVLAYAKEALKAVGRGAAETKATEFRGEGAVQARIPLGSNARALMANPAIPEGMIEEENVRAMERVPQPEGPRSPEGEPSYKVGEAVSQAAQTYLPSKKILHPLVEDVFQGFGSVGTNIASTLINPASGISNSLAQGQGEAAQNAVQAKANPKQAEQAAGLGTIAGATELVDAALPFLGSTGRVAGLIGKIGARALQGALLEGGQEGLQQFIQNLIAKGVYNPDQDVFKDVGYNALVGAIVGGGVASIAGGHGKSEEAPGSSEPPTPNQIDAALRGLKGEPDETSGRGGVNAGPPNVTGATSEPPATPPPTAPAAAPTPTPVETPPPAPATTPSVNEVDPNVVKFLADKAPPLDLGKVRPGETNVVSIDKWLRGRALDPNGPLKEEIEGNVGVNAGRIATLLGPKLYGEPANMTAVSVKEIVQNSYDAIKASMQANPGLEGAIDISLDDANRTVTVTDNGSGMTPDVLSNQFLTIAGTKKETDRASGSLGIAKMLFLFGNKALGVTTMRNGKVATMVTSGTELFNALEGSGKKPIIQVRAATAEDLKTFPQGHGTKISVAVPLDYKDSATGETKNIAFSLGTHNYPVLERSPLFDPIHVTFNGQQLPIGKHFPLDNYTPFVNINFKWGTARVYVSTENKRRYGNNLHFLSNGLWQFSTRLPLDPSNPYGELVPYEFYVDISPQVKAEDPAYPFDLNRQKFSPTTEKDFAQLTNMMSLMFAREGATQNAKNYGSIEYLTLDPKAGKVNKSAPIKIQPDVPPPPTEFARIKKGDKVLVKDGVMYINGKKIPELKPEDVRKFKLDVTDLIVPQSRINPNQVILHDNVDVEISGLEKRSLVNLAREKYGARFDEYIYLVGRAFQELRRVVVKEMKERHTSRIKEQREQGIQDKETMSTREAMDFDYAPLEKVGVGISFDETYRGVNIMVPFQAMFINPAVPVYTDPVRSGVGLAGTMVHEIAHFRERNHEAQFPAEMQDILIQLQTAEKFSWHEFNQKLVTIQNGYADVFNFLRETLTSGNFTISTRGSRLEGAGNGQALDAGSSGGLGATGPATGGGPGLLAQTLPSPSPAGAEPGPAGVSRPSATSTTPDNGRSANQRAHDSGDSGVAGQTPAVPIQPETQRARANLNALFSATGGPGAGAVHTGGGSTTTGGPSPGGTLPPQVASMAGHADRMNVFYKYMAGLDQLVRANPLFRPLVAYAEKVRQMHLEETRIQDRAVRIGKSWLKLGEQGENLSAFIDDLTNMVYRTPQEVANGVARWPTQAEFQALVQTHRLQQKALAVLGARATQTTRGTGVIGILDDFLTVVQTNAIQKAQQTISDPTMLLKKIGEIQTQVQNLRSRPYFPFMRFGDHYVVGKDAAGNTVWFETFERKGFQSAERRQMAAKRDYQRSQPNITWDHGILPENAQPFIGMPPALLESIATELQLSQQQREALEQLTFEKSPALSFKHRFQHKNYVKGYSLDFRRAFARYFFHGARYYARTKFADLLRQDLKDAENVKNSNKASSIARYMADHLYNTVLDTRGDYGLFKGAIFLWAMGYVPAAATQNLLQTPLITLPYLGAKFGDAKAMRALTQVFSHLNGFYKKGFYDNQTDFELRALGYGIETGRISETQAPEIAGMGQRATLLAGIGGNRYQRVTTQIQQNGAILFELAEQYNRRVAYRATLKLVKQNPNAPIVREAIQTYALEYQTLLGRGWNPADAQAIITASYVTDHTQYVYARYARPRFMRGRLSGTLFVFKKYLQSTLFMLGQNKKDVLPRYMLMMALLGGFAGIPGWEELRDIIRAVGRQWFGKDFNIEHELREWVLQHTNGTIPPDLVLHGFSRYGFGVPAILDLLGSFATGTPGRGLDPASGYKNVPYPVIDRSRAISMGPILPVEIGKVIGPTKDVNSTIADQVQRASGAVFSVGFNMYKFAQDQEHRLSDPKRWERAVPRLFASASKAFRAFNEGRERSGKGGPASASTISNYDPRDPEGMMEIIAMGMGYTPMKTQAKWDSIMAKQELEFYYRTSQQGILAQSFEAIRSGVPGELEAAAKARQEFNANLPTWARGYAITADQFDRSMMMRSEELNAREAGVPRQERNIPISRRIDELYPESIVDVRRVR